MQRRDNLRPNGYTVPGIFGRVLITDVGHVKRWSQPWHLSGQGVGRRRIAAFEIEHGQHDRRGDGKFAERQMAVDQDGDGDAQQCRTGTRLAEIGEPAPDDKTSRRGAAVVPGMGKWP